MFNKIYKNRIVLVTGHTGFKGSWLSIWLKELGAQVIGYSLDSPSEPNNFTACSLKEKVVHVYGDIRDIDNLLRIFQQYQPEFVFHLAAQALVRMSYNEPKLTFDTNIGGTVNVLEAARLTPSIKVLINITSDKCYENQGYVRGYRENDPLGGHDPYSASKGCCELVFAAYLRSFFSHDIVQGRKLGAASVRAGNVIGGGDWGKDRIIPDCVRALSANKPIGIRNTEAIRPWQHVFEPLSGYLWLGALLYDFPEKYSGPWNFGPNGADHLKVRELVQKFINLWGSGSFVDLSPNNFTSQSAPHEATVLRLCCDKAQTYLGWQPTLKVDECLHLTTEWYKLFYSNDSKVDMFPLCCDQIHNYTQKAKERSLRWATE